MTSKKTSNLNLRLARLQTPQNDDVIHATFDRTGDRSRGECFLKPSIATSPARLYSALLDKGAKLPERKAALSLLQKAIASIPSTVGYLRDGAGWHGDLPSMCFVLPDAVIGTSSSVVSMTARAKADCVANGLAGTLDGWIKDVAAPIAKSDVAGLALLTALAAPLFSFAALPETFVINFYGNSSAGKTSANLAAASLYGDPSQLPSWNASSTGLAQWIAANSDLPLIPDDAERASENPDDRLKRLHAMTHTITSNASRKYANIVSGPDQLGMVKLRSLLLSSSPASVEQAVNRTDGDRVRWFDISVPHGNDGGIWRPREGQPAAGNTAALSTALVEAAKANHGHAGRAYLEYLVCEQAKLSSRVSKYTQRFVRHAALDADSVEGRIARKFGLLFAAGMTARRAGILPWKKRKVLSVAKAGYDSALASAFKPTFRVSQGIAAVRSALKDKANFPQIEAASLAKASVTQGAGGYLWAQGDRVFVRLDALSNVLKSAGIGFQRDRDLPVFLAALRKAEILLKGHGVHSTRDVRIGATRLKVLEFDLSRLTEDKAQTSKTSVSG